MTGFKSKSRQSLCSALPRQRRRARDRFQVFANPHILTSRIRDAALPPHGCPADRGPPLLASPLLAFIFSIYGSTGGDANVLLAQENSFKGWFGRASCRREMDAPPIRQAQPPPVPSGIGASPRAVWSSLLSWLFSALFLIGSGLFVVNPRHQHVYRNRAGSNPDAAGNADGIAAGESKIGLARSAIRNRVETTIEFTADDVNALLQR